MADRNKMAVQNKKNEMEEERKVVKEEYENSMERLKQLPEEIGKIKDEIRWHDEVKALKMKPGALKPTEPKYEFEKTDEYQKLLAEAEARSHDTQVKALENGLKTLEDQESRIKEKLPELIQRMEVLGVDKPE